MSDEGIAGDTGGGGASSPSGGDGSSYQANLDKSVSDVILKQPGTDSEGMEDYVAERRHQDAQENGEKIDDETRNERNERLRRALDKAREESASLRGESPPETYQPPDDYGQSSEDSDQLSAEDFYRKQGANKVRYDEICAQSPEFVERANINYDVIPMRQDLVGIMQDCCDSPMDVAVLVGSDPNAIAELNMLTPKEARKWLTKFDATISFARSQPRQQYSMARHHTGAPPPLKTPRGGASPEPNPRTGPDDMKSYVAWRQRQNRGKER